MSFIQHPYTPPNLPVYAPESVGSGWRRIPLGALVRAHYQYHSVSEPPGWRLTSYWGSEGLRNDGRALYRGPASLRAWVVVLPKVVAKVWKRLLKRG